MGFNPRHKISSLQLHWAADARRDARYNAKRARRVKNPELKKMYEQEERWDIYWANRRMRIAKRYGK